VNLYTDTETRFFQNVKYIQGWSTVRVDYMMTVFLPMFIYYVSHFRVPPIYV